MMIIMITIITVITITIPIIPIIPDQREMVGPAARTKLDIPGGWTIWTVNRSRLCHLRQPLKGIEGEGKKGEVR